MSRNRSSIFLGLSLGVLIVTVIIIGTQVYYNPNVTDPSDAEYSIEPFGSGFLITADAENELSDSVTLQFIQEETDSEDILISPSSTGDSLYVEPTSPIDRIEAVSILYKDQQLHSRFVSESLTEQLSVKNIGGIAVNSNQQLRLSIEDFVRNNESISEYSWDTGARVYENRDFIETYENDGTYPASLIVTDHQDRTYRTDFNVTVGVGSEETRSIKLPDSNVSMKVEPNSVIQFKSSLEEDSPRVVEQYKWDFDNNVVGYGNSVLNQYNTEGTYNVELNVSYTNEDTESHSLNVTVDDSRTDDIYVSGRSGYQFEFTADLDSVNSDGYTWKLGDGSVVQGSEVVSYAYDEYGSYDVELSTGNNETYRKAVTTEVLVKMGEEPYTVESVSGNHSEELIQKGSVGEEDPSLAFQEGVRYRITGLPVETEFKSSAGTVLLSQSTEGVMESNPDVDWREVSEDTVIFTMTQRLGERLSTYEPIGS